MIVVIGTIGARRSDDGLAAAGPAVAVALAAVANGADVEIVGRVGDDPVGAAVLLDLARHGVGHVAVLRDAARATPETNVGLDTDAFDADATADRPVEREVAALDAADLELALNYLPGVAVIVVADPLTPGALRVVADAASWSGASLVAVGAADDLAGVPEAATVFAPPDDGDPDGAFAAMVGAYAAGLDRGDDPRAAFEAASSAVGSSAID